MKKFLLSDSDDEYYCSLIFLEFLEQVSLPNFYESDEEKTDIINDDVLQSSTNIKEKMASNGQKQSNDEHQVEFAFQSNSTNSNFSTNFLSQKGLCQKDKIQFYDPPIQEDLLIPESFFIVSDVYYKKFRNTVHEIVLRLYRLPYLESNYIAHLKGRWCSMDIKVHDPLLVTGSFEKIYHKNELTYPDQQSFFNLTYEITIDNRSGFIVQWPFFQVSPTRLSESDHCYRRSILCSLIPSDTIEPTLKRSEGTVGHLFFENTMMQQLEPNQSNLIEIVNNHATENGLQEAARKQIIENSKPIIDFANKVSINIKNQETEKKLEKDISNLAEKQKENLNQIEEEKQKIQLIEKEQIKIEEEKQKILLEKKEKTQLEAERQKIILELEKQKQNEIENENENEKQKILLEKKEQIQLEFERQQILLEMEIEMQKEEERQKNLLEELKKEILQKRIENEKIKKELKEAENKKEKIKFLNNDNISLPPYGLDVIIAEKYYQCLKFGYVGQIDMILFDSKNKLYIPFEIKTGRSANGHVWRSHQTQLFAYIAMMKDFQNEKAADYGRIFYAKDEVSNIVKPSVCDFQSLEILRNSITQKSMNGIIPDKMAGEKECSNCQCFNVCQFLSDIEDLVKGDYEPSNRSKIKIKKKKFTKRKKNFFTNQNSMFPSNESRFGQNPMFPSNESRFGQSSFNLGFNQHYEQTNDQIPFGLLNFQTENKSEDDDDDDGNNSNYNEKSIEVKINYQMLGDNQDVVYISDKSDEDEYDYQERRKYYEEYDNFYNQRFYEDQIRNDDDDEAVDNENELQKTVEPEFTEETETLPEYSLSQANFYKKINEEVLDSIYEKGFILYSNLAKSVDQRIEEGIAINGLTLNYFEGLGFSFESDKFIKSKFKPFSKFVITKNGRSPILTTGIVTSMSPTRDEIFFALDNTNDLHYFETDLCIDLITFINDRTIQIQNLLRLFIYSPSNLNKITSMLIDNEKSDRIDTDNNSQYDYFYKQFNEDQRKALKNSIDSIDYSIISGCKSSGKTVLLSGLIQYYSNKQVNVLIICPTESSLNHLCDLQKDIVAIRRYKGDFMNQIKVKTAAHIGFFNGMTINEFNSISVAENSYDVLIVDDCEKIKISDLIGPMNASKKHIFCGDIYQSRRDISSIFSFVDIDKNQVNFLRGKYRKSREIHCIENSLIYNNSTMLMDNSIKINLDLSKLEIFHHVHQSWLLPVLSSPTFFIDSEFDSEKSDKICNIESTVCAALAVSFVICGVRKKSIGILCYDEKCTSLIKRALSLFFESLTEFDDSKESIEVNSYSNYYKNIDHSIESNRILIVCLGELHAVSSTEASLSILEAKERIYLVGSKTIVEMNPFFCKLVRKIDGCEKISYDVLNSNEFPFNRMNELI